MATETGAHTPGYDSSLFVKEGMKAQVEFYDKWQVGYDQEVEKKGYGGPEQLAKFVEQYVPDKNAKIIDVVAGSGILAHVLKRHGYHNIEGIDGSQKMLDIAKERNIYTKYHCELLHPHLPAELPEEHSFDLAVASGCFAPGHLNSNHRIVFAKLLKKGGKAIFVVNGKFYKDDSHWNKEWEWDHDLEAAFKEWEMLGIWKRLHSVIKEGYFQGIEGRYYIFEML